MGCDGGSIPKRAELVRTKRAETGQPQDVKQSRLEAFKYCALSKEPLRSPIVTCKQGRLYNKDALLRLLLHRKSTEACSSGELEAELELIKHIRGMKDLVELNTTDNPDFVSSPSVSSPFICPVTNKELNGLFNFYFLKGCGCVLSEQAIKEIPSQLCLKCSKSRLEDDLILIDPVNDKSSTEEASEKKPLTKKRPLCPPEDPQPPYLPSEDGYRLSIETTPSSFRKTPAIIALYKKP